MPSPSRWGRASCAPRRPDRSWPPSRSTKPATSRLPSPLRRRQPHPSPFRARDPPMTRPIFFLSDFGLTDTYVGIVKAVILGIAPDARIVDLTHDIPAQDVRAGAFALLTAAPYLPPDALVLAVVDPGVGTARRPIAVQVGGRTFVGPDNGLLSWAVRKSPNPQPLPPCAREGEPMTIVVLDRPAFWLPSVSATFHGRDLFGP